MSSSPVRSRLNFLSRAAARGQPGRTGSPTNKLTDVPTPSTISSQNHHNGKHRYSEFGSIDDDHRYGADSPHKKESPRQSLRDTSRTRSKRSTSPLRNEKASVTPSDGGRHSMQQTAIPRFSWRLARAYILLKIQPADTFAVSGVNFSDWPKTKIPTLGASPSGCRVQEMYKVILPGVGPRGRDVKLFVKVIPIAMWNAQWESENKWNGEYATDGENFVMEAAVLAFLHEYAPGIAPKLVGLLELSADGRKTAASQRRDSQVSHMVVISELYGEDLLDYLDRRDRKNKPLTSQEKRALQLGCVLLMKRLHSLGLAHLDFTPENILVGPDGLRLCDFAKTTPIWSPNLRHVHPPPNETKTLNPFESCEPTVGKGAYMPPECWKVYWKLETQRILKPLEDLSALRRPEERAPFYFRVSSADVYMLGVLIFWIWSDGGIWRISDPRQDEKYYHLVKSGMNFDLFRECRNWPDDLKECISKVLAVEAFRRATITEVANHPWFMDCLEDEEELEYLRPYVNEHTFRGLLGEDLPNNNDRDSTKISGALDEYGE